MRQRKQVANILAQKQSFFYIYRQKDRKSADTYAAGFQRGRIDYALISDEDKVNILGNNALRLFEEKLK